jgi:hypothetical protein
MVLTCYACHTPFQLQRWNPLRVTVTCPTAGCGRNVYLGESVDRTYGPALGKEAKAILTGLDNVAGGRGRSSLAHLADLGALRVERLLKDAVPLTNAAVSLVASPRRPQASLDLFGHPLLKKLLVRPRVSA